MAYDALFKELLRAFFAEFMQRFFPEEAARLDLHRVTFLEQETVTDVGRGRRRTLDLIAQVMTRDGHPELVLIHVEIQARPEPDFPWRMFEYYGLLRRRHRLPVLPIVLYIAGGHGQETWEEYREGWFTRTIVTFQYLRLRLKGRRATAAVREDDPLVATLAVLMDRRGADLAALKVSSLSVIAQARLDEARQWLLVNFVQTYLPLRAAEEQRYQAMLTREENRMARQQELTWGDRKIEEGRQEGRREGVLRGKREAVLTVLRSRFTIVPEDLAKRIEAIQAEAELERLLERAATVSHPEELRGALPN